MGQFPTLTLSEMVKNKTVRFTHYRDRELWYVTEDGFEFPVHIDAAAGAMFKDYDNAIYFMRFIRKRMAEVASWRDK